MSEPEQKDKYEGARKHTNIGRRTGPPLGRNRLGTSKRRTPRSYIVKIWKKSSQKKSYPPVPGPPISLSIHANRRGNFDRSRLHLPMAIPRSTPETQQSTQVYMQVGQLVSLQLQTRFVLRHRHIPLSLPSLPEEVQGRTHSSGEFHTPRVAPRTRLKQE